MAYDLQTILNHVEQIRRAIYGEEVRGSISDSIELMAYETATVGDFKDTMTEEMQKFQDVVNEDIKTFKENMVNNHIQLTQEVNGKITEFTKDIENKFENFTIQMNTDFKSFKDDTNKTITEFTTKMLGEYKEFTENVTKEVTDMKEEMTKHKQEVDGILADYLKQLNETLATQKSELEQMKKEIEDKLAEAGQANPNLELIDAREGEQTLKTNLNKNYARKEYVLGEIDKENTTKYSSVEVAQEPIKTNSHEGVFRITQIQGSSKQNPETLEVTGVSSVDVKVTGEAGEEKEIHTDFSPCLHGISKDIYDEYNAGTITRKIGVAILDDTVNWRASTIKSDSYIRFFHYWAYSGGKEYSTCLNTFSTKELTRTEYGDDTTDEGWYSDRSFAIKISKDKLETPDIEGFKKYIKENPITVYFELVEPRLESYKVEPALCFKNSTIEVKSTPPTTATVTYPQTMGGRVALIETGVSDLRGVTQDLGRRTNKLENYMNLNSNPVLTINDQAPDELGNIDISGGSIDITRVTYKELVELQTQNKLETGAIYILTDYQTIYQQPVTNNIVTLDKEEDLILTANDTSSLRTVCYSTKYPHDIIHYDINNNICEDKKTPRPGFIIYRHDTLTGNICSYDFRTMLWARWKPNLQQYYKNDELEDYEVWTGGETKLDVIYKADTKLLIAKKVATPKNPTDSNVFTEVYPDTNIGMLFPEKLLIFKKGETKLELAQGELHERLTFDGGCCNNILSNSCRNNVLGKNCCHNFFDNECRNNTFGSGCDYNSFGNICNGNLFLGYSSKNTFGNDCSYNIFLTGVSCNIFGNRSSYNYLGEKCSAQILGNECKNNIFDHANEANSFGSYCNNNTFGNQCSNNRFGNSCYNNTFGKVCNNNSFGNGYTYNIFGDGCYFNTFGNQCSNNRFGNSCSKNTFGDGCYNNKANNDWYGNSFSNDCNNNIFGIGCKRNTLGNGCYNNQFGNNCCDNSFNSNCFGNKFGNDCNNNNLGSGCFGNKFGSNCKQLIIKILYAKDISNLDIYSKTYTINIGRNSNGDYVYWYLDGNDAPVYNKIP